MKSHDKLQHEDVINERSNDMRAVSLVLKNLSYNNLGYYNFHDLTFITRSKITPHPDHPPSRSPPIQITPHPDHRGVSRPVCICLSRYVHGTVSLFGEAWAALRAALQGLVAPVTLPLVALQRNQARVFCCSPCHPDTSCDSQTTCWNVRAA